MDAQLIEKLDQRRYKVLLWKTINYGLIFPCLFMIVFAANMGVFTYIWLAVMLLLSASQYTAYSEDQKIKNEINGNPELEAALNNELVIHYRNLSYKWGFYVMFAAVGTVGTLSILKVHISVLLACFIIIYAGTLSFNIFRLLLMKK